MGTDCFIDEALIQQSAICHMKPPDFYDIKYLQSFFRSEIMGPYLMGPDRHIWGSKEQPKAYSKELICLNPRLEVDFFSKFIGEHAVTFLKKCCCFGIRRSDSKSGNIAVRDDRIFRVTMWITSLIASAFPIISIAVLNQIHLMSNRITVIAAFNVLIALCLMHFTEAKRTEIFSVTAA